MVSMVNNIFEAQCQATPYKVIGWDKWEEEDFKVFSLPTTQVGLVWFPNLQRRMYYECD